MKTLKSIAAGAMLLFVCFMANAAVKPAANKLSKDDAINTYINAITKGSTDNLDELFDDGLQFNMHRGDNVNTLNKEQMIKYLKNNTVADTDVKTTTTAVLDDENNAKVKIEFKYDGYVRTDVVSLDKSFGWKIVSVNSSFK